MYYLFVCFILAGLILNNISKKFVLYNVSYKREISSVRAEIGEELHISVIIENKKLLPVTFLQVTEKFPAEMEYKYEADLNVNSGSLYHKTTMMILPYQRIKRDFIIKFNQRGKYILRDVTLTAGDLLGLNTEYKNIEFIQEIVIFPKPLNLEVEASEAGDYIGDIRAKMLLIEDPIITAGIREYTGFEPEKYIHWPSSLKTGNLMVRNFDFTVDNSVFILLNGECSKPFWSWIDKDAIEKCFSLARSIIDDLEKNHIKYGFAGNPQTGGFLNYSNFIRPSLGMGHYYNIIEYIGRSDYSIGTEFENLLKIILTSHISCRTFIIITPVILEPYINLISELKNYSDETAVFSVRQDNMELISDNIKKYVL